jgi:hypothetical protein
MLEREINSCNMQTDRIPTLIEGVRGWSKRLGRWRAIEQ